LSDDVIATIDDRWQVGDTPREVVAWLRRYRGVEVTFEQVRLRFVRLSEAW